MHPAYRGSTDQLNPAPSLHEQALMRMRHSPTRSSFVTETEVQDDSVPPVPPIPAGISNEKRGRRSRSWGNASLMRRPPEREFTLPAKSSRSLGASPVIAQFDGHNEVRGTVPPVGVIVPSRVPWNINEQDRNSSPRSHRSSSVGKSLWMGDISPILSKRTPDIDDNHQPVLPGETDGTTVPAEFVHHYAQHHDGASIHLQESSGKLDVEPSSDA